MNKNNLPIYFSLAVILGIIIGIFFSGNSSSAVFSKNNLQEQKIKKLIYFIEQDYVDHVNTGELLDGAIAEMLEKLDPHSVYIPKDELGRVTESMEGKFVGIGVSFLMYNDTVAITNVIEGGPSEKAGLLAGDKILSINGIIVRNWVEIVNFIKKSPDIKLSLYKVRFYYEL